MSKPLLLDTFCGAGGCTKGYQRAGFYVVGVDNRLQKNYCGDEFFQGDALEFIREHGREFDVVGASPPCQKYTKLRYLWNRKYPDLVAATRETLIETGKPYIIENVSGSPLKNYVMLCGTMFDLDVVRHRYFECRPTIWFPPATCKHNKPVVKSGRRPDLNKEFHSIVGHFSGVAEARIAMDISWMIQTELAQAIPPAYTEWIGLQMRERLQI